jgi:hypothetical protein
MHGKISLLRLDPKTPKKFKLFWHKNVFLFLLKILIPSPLGIKTKNTIPL